MPMNLPNAISLLRIPLAAAFIVADALAVRLAILAAAAFSDWIDGRLARGTGRVTRAGEIIDPIADRTFMIAALVTLTLEARLPLWTLPLLLLRDIGVVLGAIVIFAIDPGARIPARPAGKRLTWIQFIAVGVLLLRPDLIFWVVPPVAILGVAALSDYGRQAIRLLRARRAG